MCMTNAYILYTTYGPNGITLDHEEFILSIARTLIEEELRTSHLNTTHVRTENFVQNDLTGDHFPEEIPRKRDKKENQVGLVLHAMDHGLISKIKNYLNVVHDMVCKLQKSFMCNNLLQNFSH